MSIDYLDILKKKYGAPRAPENQFDFDGDFNINDDGEHISLRGLLEFVERDLLHDLLIHTRSNQTKCAVLMGWNRGTLRKRLKKYGWL